MTVPKKNGHFYFIGNCVSIKQKYCMSLANARFTCSEMDKSKTVAVGIRRSRFLVLLFGLR